MSIIYSATYSNVPVYEYTVEGNHVMRRRADNWINATHILKVADFDKPARTRILEREVQRGTHEKVQGGYGKYQGTWVPLADGRDLASRIGCLDRLLPIFDFVPGDRSPPPAPRHATAASAKPRGANAAVSRRVPVASRQVSDISYENYSQGFPDDRTPDNRSMVSESDADMLPNSQYSTGSRKRKRNAEQPPLVMSAEDTQHLMWSDELLDYFMLQRTDQDVPRAPEPGPGIDVNRPVDEKGHTPLHWASAMGDMAMVRQLVNRGARLDSETQAGETPLMHAINFTNNYDKQTMPILMSMLHSTVGQKDWYESTVLHHISASTCSKSKYLTARYYFVSILDKLLDLYEQHEVRQLIDQQDSNGDTALFIAAKYGARKCVRTLVDYGARPDFVNKKGETAVNLINDLNARRQTKHRGLSSSPVAPPQTSSNLLDPALTQSAVFRSYSSEAASMLASQLPNLVNSRAEALATALEQELAEREREVQESERLLQQRRREIETLQAQSSALLAQEDSVQVDNAQAAELDALMHDCKALFEQEQAMAFDRKLRENGGHEEVSSTPAELKSFDQANEKSKLGRQLANIQAEHASLISQLVSAQALAGQGERHALYKRLIQGAVGVKAEDVETMLPEILAELEEAREDAAHGGQEHGSALVDAAAMAAPLASAALESSDRTTAGSGLLQRSAMNHSVHVLG